MPWRWSRSTPRLISWPRPTILWRWLTLLQAATVAAGGRPPLALPPGEAGRVSGPDTIDCIAPAQGWEAFWSDQVRAKRDGAAWLQALLDEGWLTAPGSRTALPERLAVVELHGESVLVTTDREGALQLAEAGHAVGPELHELAVEDRGRCRDSLAQGRHEPGEARAPVLAAAGQEANVVAVEAGEDVAAALAGERVVRLKGGDPFIFGRGGEEVEALRAAGIEVEVVPGISSALGCAASAQIPLTHRDMAQAVTLVTGHAKLGEEPDLDWDALSRANQTVVVFMGVGTAGTIAARLVAAGRGPDTPVAVIENGTRSDEIRAFGALGELSEIIQRAGIQGPALLIIGEVVALAKDAPTVQPAIPHSAKPAAPSLADLWRMFS